MRCFSITGTTMGRRAATYVPPPPSCPVSRDDSNTNLAFKEDFHVDDQEGPHGPDAAHAAVSAVGQLCPGPVWPGIVFVVLLVLDGLQYLVLSAGLQPL